MPAGVGVWNKATNRWKKVIRRSVGSMEEGMGAGKVSMGIVLQSWRWGWGIRPGGTERGEKVCLPVLIFFNVWPVLQ